MNTNDQWFNPGDKVMRVALNVAKGAILGLPPDVPYGKVFCATGCWTDHWGDNVITLAHIERNRCFVARNFRRVDEIKLCVEAAKHIKQREEELV